MTHFEVFGLPQRYPLDAAALEQRYRELSLKLHPDRVAGGDARERRLALERTTALNDAYKVLKDPVKRATYLLKLRGVDLDREEAGARPVLPMEFLEEIMELREQLSFAREQKDFERARQMGEQVASSQAAALAQAGAALTELDDGKGGEKALETAAHQLARVRYFTRFLEEVEQIEEEALA